MSESNKIPRADELAEILSRLNELASAVEILLDMSKRHCEELSERREDLRVLQTKILKHQAR